jgi:hypothetical protein
MIRWIIRDPGFIALVSLVVLAVGMLLVVRVF